MSESTRRGFLGAAGAGAAALGAAAVAPSAFAAGGRRRLSARQLQSRQPVVAYVKDRRRGTVSLMVGEREVLVTDHDLVARMLEAVGE
jgi:hypothetical protein